MRYGMLLMLTLWLGTARAQFSADSIHTDFVRYQRRVDFDHFLREKTIAAAFSKPLDSSTEDYFREACWSVAQYNILTPAVKDGFDKMIKAYVLLDPSTKRAMLEAIYTTTTKEYAAPLALLAVSETNPRLFAMQLMYIFRIEPHAALSLKKQLYQRFPDANNIPVLNELDKYLSRYQPAYIQPLPPVIALFNNQRQLGYKMIYSFQRWNRDYGGLAIVQQTDGSFAKDENGRLLVFEQLARSASDLPYFITNGNTPQGIFSIQGMAVSHNKLIGPTPNIQLVMPFEADSAFWHNQYDSAKDALANYLQLLPEEWRNYAPITESFYAGKAGRSEIIAHGTTIDPDYFKDKPYYPLTPTQGCLCAKETWNIFTGKLLASEQLRLVNSFLSTPGDRGFLYVVNLDNQQRAVSREELELLVRAFEKK